MMPTASDAERAAALREIARQLIERQHEPDLIERAIVALQAHLTDE
jgi:hypothetical protein